jgi:hypothetical protein
VKSHFNNNLQGGLDISKNFISYIPNGLCSVNLKVSENLVNEFPECFDFENSYKLKIHYSQNGDEVEFLPLFGNDYNETSFHWDFGNGETSNLEKPTHRYEKYGNYEVVLKAGNLEVVKEIDFWKRELEIEARKWYLLSNPTREIVYLPENTVSWVFRREKWILNPLWIEPTEGFFLKSEKDFTLEFDGTNYSKIEPSNKWQLLGNGESSYDLEKSYIFRNGSWIVNPEKIEPFEGFWLKDIFNTSPFW